MTEVRALLSSSQVGTLALFLVLAWRIAGYYGVDRYLLPLLGTPWTGSLIKRAGQSTLKHATMATQ